MLERRLAQPNLSWRPASILSWWGVRAELAFAVGIAYFLAARLSLALLTEPDGVAVFWPAAGVSAGTLIALGREARWPVGLGAVVATIVANMLGDRNLWSAIVFGLCNAGEAILTAWFVEHQFGPSFQLDRLSRVLGLSAAAGAAAAISGIGGTLGYVFFHSSAAPIPTIWQHWFASDGLGIIAVAPLLIGFAAAWRHPPSRTVLIDGLVSLAVLGVMSGIVFLAPREPWSSALPVAFTFPLLLWVGARCPPVFAAGASFIVALAIVVTTTFGIGFFGDPNVPIGDHILAARAGILASSLCALVLAALFAERRRSEAALKEGEASLQEALTAGRVIAFAWDPLTRTSRRSDNAAQILGFDPKGTFTAREFLAHLHPDDRAEFKAAVYGLSPANPTYAVTFRFIRPDGREVWLAETSAAEFDATGRYVRLKGITRDITARKRAEAQQDLLISELDHRAKNVLARVAAMVSYTRRGIGSTQEFYEALDRRIQSMADAHALLSQRRWHDVGVMDLVRRQLAPYTTSMNTLIDGPDIKLSAEATQALAMVLQELVTNALKYGSLSTASGRVSVTWSRASREPRKARLILAWHETGGPPITAPARSGFGTSLIRGLIPRELGGTAELAFAPDGARCDIEIPLDT